MIKKFFHDEYITAFLIISSFIITIIPSLNKACLMSGNIDFTLLTTTLSHTSIKNHWINNVILIALLGPSIERRFGIIRTSFMIIFTAISTSLLSYLLSVRSCGMSDICFMFIILNCFCRQERFISFSCLFLICIELLPEIPKLFNNTNISNSSHLIGGLLGLVFGYLNNLIEEKVNK